MPSPLSSGWLWPLSGGGRAPSRGILAGTREKSEPKLETKFDRLFEEEHQRRRRARSQSNRRSEKVFSVTKQEVIESKEKNKTIYTGSSELNGHKLREAAACLREEVLQVAPPERRALPGKTQAYSSAERHALGLDCDEVLPGLILASGKTVKTVAYMRELRVTHVINTASRDVWLPTEKLSNMGVEVFQFHVDDVPSANIAPFFRPAADIVRRAQQSGGLLVVNCLVGFSRSATVLIAALMIVRHWTLAHAFRALRLRRQVKPNLGFMTQLLALEIQLKQQGIILV